MAPWPISKAEREARRSSPKRNGVPVVGAGLPCTGQGAGRDEVGRKLMRADDPVPALLEQHHGAAQNLIVARGR